MTEIEYGIRHNRTNTIVEKGMTKEQSENLIMLWECGGGEPGTFILVYREISQWFTEERDWK